MPLDRLLSCGLFFFVMSITPGPNNVLLLASGLNFGFRRSVPQMVGIGVGFAVMLLAVGFGLGPAFSRWPILHTGLQIVGAAYMLWLAWRIANAGPVEAKAGGAQPMTVLQSALFQWLNPKAWLMLVSAVATYASPDAYSTSLLAMAVMFFVIYPTGAVPWVAGGVALRQLMADRRRVRIFNIAMAVLLVASLWPIMADFLPR